MRNYSFLQVEEVEETLPDGTVVIKRITTQHITERITEREVSDEISEGELGMDQVAAGRKSSFSCPVAAQ